MTPPLTVKQEDMLQKVYETNRFGRNRVIDALRLAYPDSEDLPSYRQTLEWLKGQEDHQIHQRPTKALTIAPIKQLEPGHLQADLFIMSSYADRGYRSCLVVVDIFTKYVAAEALRSESEAVVTAAMVKILDRFPTSIKVTTVQTDPGSHFRSLFNSMLKNRGVKHFYSQVARPQSNAVVERVNGVIKSALFKQMTAKQDRRWALYLPQVLASINSVRSYTTGESPDQLVKASAETHAEVAAKVHAVLDKRYPSKVIGEPLAVGTFVRLKRVLGTYEKAGVLGYWSQDVYKVRRSVVSNNPQIIPTYIIEALDGSVVQGRQPRSNLLEIPDPGEAPVALVEDEDRESGPALPDDPRRSTRKQGEYQVEYIFGKEKRGRKLYYHVKWVGYPLEEATWEPIKNLTNAKELIREYNEGEGH